jgi:hypothetical protein
LKIFQEFHDRYSQASTYGQLGLVAEAEKDFALSLGYFATALEIYSQYKDNYWREITVQNLSRLLHTTTPPWDPMAAIASLEAKEETKDQIRKIGA